MELLFMDPVFKEAIWGGTKLRDVFDYEIPSDTTGECWAISGHANGMSRVAGGRFDGKTLGELWKEEPEIFGNYPGSQVPLLIKIIDAKNDLSIQVHPEIVIGHNAKDKAEVEKMIRNHEWSDFIRKVPVHKGDFFQINPGCVHAIKGGTLILETQQSSDITYRVYDYDRLQNGKPRQLHVEQSIDVIEAPFKTADIDTFTEEIPGAVHTHFVTCKFYSVDKYDIDGVFTLDAKKYYTNVSVIAGEGTVNGIPVKKGTHFIIPANFNGCRFEGKLSVICSNPEA